MPSMVNFASGSLALTVRVTRRGLMSTDCVVDRPLLSVTVRVMTYQVVSILSAPRGITTLPLGPTMLSRNGWM